MLLGKDQGRKGGILEGTDFQIIRFNLSKVKELATGKDQDRKGGNLEGTDIQIIRFNLSKVKELATALGAVNQVKKLMEDGC